MEIVSDACQYFFYFLCVFASEYPGDQLDSSHVDGLFLLRALV